MISTQVLANCIEELHNITKVDLCVYDADGIEVVSTFDNEEVTGDMIRYFIASPADSQVIGIHHLLKVSEEGELLYALVARGSGDEATWLVKLRSASCCSCRVLIRSVLTGITFSRIC